MVDAVLPSSVSKLVKMQFAGQVAGKQIYRIDNTDPT